MLAAFPRMGHIDILLGDLLDRLGIDYLLPPVNSEKTLVLGAKYAPEFSCLPLKLNIGNFIEALELGADTLIMAGGRGPCRFGYYAEIERRILKDAGYDFNMITIEPPSLGFFKFVGPIKKVSGKSIRKIWRALKESFPKARAFDQLEKLVLKTRCYEIKTGATTKA
ncbi:MAG TPA: CoA protein activase, partial [Actinobacteria bacterium]|nr:CoA protein activase [Actinomycetes bacterium]HEX21751.1 CoA protein activase [Actinomycetota bacterium]